MVYAVVFGINGEEDLGLFPFGGQTDVQGDESSAVTVVSHADRLTITYRW